MANLTRVLFLDIDGVVLPGRAYLLPNQTSGIALTFDPSCVAMLNELCRTTQRKIVVSSSWVKFFGDYKVGGVTIREHLVSQGIRDEYFHEDTLTDKAINWRYDRVDDWLYRHGHTKDPIDYVILDDIPPNDERPYGDRYYQTDFDEGITMKIFREIQARDWTPATV